MNEEMLKRFAKAYKNVRQKRKYVSHDGKNVLTIKPVFDWEGLQRLRERMRGKVPAGESLRLLRELRGR